jgi:nucleoside 2-deoxyribosyltransferase
MTIIGGTYFEICIDPVWNELYGSGLRGAAALSGQIPDIDFFSFVGIEDLERTQAICSAYNINPHLTTIKDTVLFKYYHPLSKPTTNYDERYWKHSEITEVSADIILMYGMIEGDCKVNGNYVVYDPQNGRSFKSTNSTAAHLALVLNRNEAILLSNLSDELELEAIGKYLLVQEDADVVIIKDGTNGAFVIEPSKITTVQVYKTDTVWPIGSGDVFSAVFAWKWAYQKLNASDAATFASKFTALYCQNKNLPLPNDPPSFQPISKPTTHRKIYLAGPFFNLAERWLVNEFREKLIELGSQVFSPYYDIGIGTSKEIVDKDLSGLDNSDTVLAILNGMDAGTVFEVGYAVALKKRVIIYVENVNPNDLTMFQGADVEITDDFSTAAYKASW